MSLSAEHLDIRYAIIYIKYNHVDCVLLDNI